MQRTLSLCKEGSVMAPFHKGEIMKTICCALCAITLVFLVPQAEGADWVYMGTDEEMGIEWSYDVKTLTESQAGIMKVWILSEYSDEGRKKELQWRMNEG